ncbi:hypothetical protein HQ584_05505 [Patescibacteria group bacterium]|nr:hypothetical protein [Patescibacteria group bacterium]
MPQDQDIPLQLALEGYYAGICESATFADEVMLPQLRAIESITRSSNKSLTKKEEHLIQLYQRVCLWIKSVKVLNNAVHFQAVTSIARSVFELLVDIKLLIDDNPKDAVARIDAFIQMERFRKAEDYTDFKKKNPGLEYIKNLKRDIFANKAGESDRIKKLKEKYWGKGKGRIEHWSGWGTKCRLQKAGKKYELLYYESISLWNWYVHSAGLTGTKGISSDGLKAVFGKALENIVDIFCDTTEFVAKELKLKPAMPEFDKWIQRIRTAVGMVILEQ